MAQESTEEWIARLNIERFETLIVDETDRSRLALLRSQLDEQRAQLAALGRSTAKPVSHPSVSSSRSSPDPRS